MLVTPGSERVNYQFTRSEMGLFSRLPFKWTQNAGKKLFKRKIPKKAGCFLLLLNTLDVIVFYLVSKILEIPSQKIKLLYRAKTWQSPGCQRRLKMYQGDRKLRFDNPICDYVMIYFSSMY